MDGTSCRRSATRETIGVVRGILKLQDFRRSDGNVLS